MNAPFHSPERAAMAVHTFEAVAEITSGKRSTYHSR